MEGIGQGNAPVPCSCRSSSHRLQQERLVGRDGGSNGAFDHSRHVQDPRLAPRTRSG